MAIPPNTFIPIPRGLYIVMWLEFLLFVPFSISQLRGRIQIRVGSLCTKPSGQSNLLAGRDAQRRWRVGPHVHARQRVVGRHDFSV